MKINLVSKIVLVLLGVLLSIGCGKKAEDLAPDVDTDTGFSESGSAVVPDKWWKALGDRELNKLIEQGLSKNFDLKTTWQRLKRARAVAKREYSFLFPSLDAFADAQISGQDSRVQESLQLGLNSEYEVDLWGKISSSLEAERYRVNATKNEYQTAALSLSVEIARTWYRLSESRMRLEIVREQMRTNRKLVELLQRRFNSGQVRRADMLRQKSLLESTLEQEQTVQSRIGVLKHQLAVLLGTSPQKGLNYAGSGLPEIPPLPDTGIPAQLLRRRPDVRSAFNQLKAADRDLAAAISKQYPRITLTASLSSTEDDFNDIFQNWARSFTGSLVAPLLDAGRRSAEVERTRAVRKQRLYEYGQAILESFREVEDALLQEKKQLQRIKRIREQLQLARETHRQEKLEYYNGMAEYTDVLNALAEAQSLDRELVSARLQRLEYRMALYRALAGGFEIGERGAGDK